MDTTSARDDDAALARSLDGEFSSHEAEVNGTRLHYVEGGSGEPLVLIGGWLQTWWQWHKVMPALARRYRVIAVDIRGMGSSAKPAGGYDKKTMARDIYELLRHLGLPAVSIVGHDIGGMVAYSFAANHPEATTRLVLLDAPHPDAAWSSFTLLPAPDQDVNASFPWWLAFNQVHGLPEQLLDGRMRLLIDWLFDTYAKDPGSIDEHSRRIYARAYSSPDAIRAGASWYQAFNRDIADERTYGPMTTPTLALGGSGSNHALLRQVLPSKGPDIDVVEVSDTGHYIPEERPQLLVDALIGFLG
ncbi:pimeloyl-ACP methyl ester carboxylesterase [Lipingzhangella halophila]|uniref:Pimeloyl-ACP methyl ester carboxylesterase n=1 Tax=Lipingzhangella halophila TaxID=1783352 RepID=A0A7W7W3B2_9ACTN|nr:alpha/beta hydrolase [Lipingzhangella halophila]MBB4932862.1 pimeloyl-ACP methyl ester carboxylesterase [Lipingzhangella halophila]